MTDQEFYIGWQPVAPAGFARHIKRVVIILAIVFTVLGIMLALLQKKFSTAVFEFGTLTEVSGIYFDSPVPGIKVISSKDILGRSSYITIPIVGYGKSGAEGIISELEMERKTSLNQKQVVLKGTLLYNDGKTLLQIDKNENPLVSVGNAALPEELPQKQELGVLNIKGEIVDPKCFFGVMKPGEGKVHKDCAVRCILGGIPPVLRVQNTKGETDYYLLATEIGARINEVVKDVVAEPVSITARAVKQDDWIVLYLDGKAGIERISGRELFMPDAVAALCVAQ